MVRPDGLAACAVVLAVSVVGACGPSVVELSAGTGGAGAGSTSGAAGSSRSSSTSSSGDESSTGEPQFEGPGCGEPPVCDRGTFEGHVRIESAADLAQVEGFTEVTGMLEVMNSEDLVCLDTLACLEVVGRDVRIQGNAALRSTEGLSGLREIGQDSGYRTVSGDVIVTHNAVLERLAGFAVREVYRSVLILENPSLRVVSAFRELRTLVGLHVTSNPNLDSLVGLGDVEEVDLCNVSFNESLCWDEVVGVCGDLEVRRWRTAVYNHPRCPGPPEGSYQDRTEGQWECYFSIDDCPLGEKCMPVANDGGTHENHIACRPVVENPVGPGDVCSQLGGEAEGFDTCERHSVCRDGVCVAMCRGGHEQGACLLPEEYCSVNGSGTLVLCLNACDPIAQNCPEDEACYPVDHFFQCAPVAAAGPAGSGASCEFINGCNPGLLCGNPGLVSDCPPGSRGCCTEICDVTAPDCPRDLECMGWYGDDYPRLVPPHLENVGVCVDPL